MNNPQQTLSPDFKDALTHLLLQLADDDFLYAYRGSEWLGLAPHIEEDVAFSSINQDSMGHAAMFYSLLEELGQGKADDLAHGRSAQERRNCILVERVNGPGHYMEAPEYDWAYSVVRNFFYTNAKKIKMDSLKLSTYQPLADIAVKVNTELYYHLLHWKTWFIQLVSTTDEAREKMLKALNQVQSDFADVFSLGEHAEKITQFGLIEAEDELKAKFKFQLQTIMEPLNLHIQLPATAAQNGRNGEHSQELESALSTLAEVYNLDPVSPW